MLTALAILPVVSLFSEALGPGTHRLEVAVGRETRSAIVHIPPPQAEGPAARPVVLCFHGGGSNEQAQMAYCGLNEKADQAGFIVVYPAGSGWFDAILTWNAGNCCGYAERNGIDDVAFVRLLLDELAQRVPVDPKRVFATGISNGGMLAYRLASELSDRIAAIAAVAGTMGTETCHPSRPVSILHFHGTADEHLPFGGGRGPRTSPGNTFISVPHSLSAWVRANGCPDTPVITHMPDAAADGMTVERHVYGPGQDGAEVVLYKVLGGGHTWPGRTARERLLGPTTQDISANDLMWEFFQRHARP